MSHAVNVSVNMRDTIGDRIDHVRLRYTSLRAPQTIPDTAARQAKARVVVPSMHPKHTPRSTSLSRRLPDLYHVDCAHGLQWTRTHNACKSVAIASLASRSCGQPHATAAMGAREEPTERTQQACALVKLAESRTCEPRAMHAG